MSSLFRALTEQLLQPRSLAVVLSLGIHGILGASDPVLSVFSPPTKTPGKVGLVELTSAEMRRLPQSPTQISPPKFTISPIPAPPNIVPPLPPEPSSIQLPSLPPEKLSLLPPRPALPPLNSQPPSNDIPPNPPRNKPSIIITPPPLTSPPVNLIPPPLQGEDLPGVPQRRNDPQTEDDLERLRNSDPRRPHFDPPTIFTPENFPQGGSTANPNEKIAVKPTPNPVPPIPGNPGKTPTTGPSPIVDDLTQKNRLKDMAFANTYTAMFERFQSAYPGLEMTKPVNVLVAYPQEACSQKIEDKIIYGVVVKPEGTIAANPELIITQGYNVLNLAAKNAINSYTFPKSSAPKLYPLVFEFKYDENVCSSRPVSPIQPPSPSPSTQPSPSPSTQPSIQPSPSPSTQPSTQPSPSPSTQPSTQPSPSPSTQPSIQPSPEVSPKPSSQPQSPPSPEVSPTPSSQPEVSPSPEVSPTPSLQPEVSPTQG